MPPKLLPLAALLLFRASTTLACLNDREALTSENEFRSRYESPANPGTAPDAPTFNSQALPSTSQWSPAGLAVFATGILLITLATRIARRKLIPREAKS